MLSITLFLISLFVPAYCTVPRNGGGAPEHCGLGALSLAFGFLGAFSSDSPFGHWAWMANPFLLASGIMIAKGRKMVSIVLASISLLFAVSFLHADWITDGWTGHSIARVEVGYWLWLTSIAVALVAAVVGTAGVRLPIRPPPELRASRSPGG